MIAIAVHGITLLGDPWLNPGLAGITVPFAMGFRRCGPGSAIIAGYLAALLGLSFYVRRRIGARLWRKAHRVTIVVYLLGLVHALGAGTDASAVWLRWWVLLTVARDRRPLRLPGVRGWRQARSLAGTRRRPGARRARDHRPSLPPPIRGARFPDPDPRGGMMEDQGVVIVGGGLAAQRCAETLRRRGYEGAGADRLRRARSAL